jgi:hypothetical protein
MAGVANADVEIDLEDRASLQGGKLRVRQRQIDDRLSGRRAQSEQHGAC